MNFKPYIIQIFKQSKKSLNSSYLRLPRKLSRYVKTVEKAQNIQCRNSNVGTNKMGLNVTEHVPSEGILLNPGMLLSELTAMIQKLIGPSQCQKTQC